MFRNLCHSTDDLKFVIGGYSGMMKWEKPDSGKM